MKQTHTFEKCYQLLRLDHNSSWDELRKSYRQLIRKWHPDRYPDEQEKAVADSKLKDINTAYTQLSNYYQKTGVLPFAKTHLRQAESPVSEHQTQTASENPVKEGARPAKPAYSKFTPPKKSKIKVPAYVFGMLFVALASFVLYDIESIEKFIDTYLENTRQYKESRAQKYNAQINTSNQATTQTPGYDDTVTAEKTSEGLSEDHADTHSAAISDHQVVEKFFTYGSSIADVALIQGPPDRMEANTWYYGESEVHFVDGRVDYWYRTADKPLKAKAIITSIKK